MKTRRATANPGPSARNLRSPFDDAVTTRTSAVRLPGLDLEPAVLLAIPEIEHETDHQPDEQPHPIGPPEPVNHRAAGHDAEYRHDRQRRNGEAADQIRSTNPHDPHARADENERKERPDARHFAHDVLRNERSEEPREQEEQHVRFVRSPISRM